MTAVKLMVLYPFPRDVAKFENDYREHVALLHQKMKIPIDVKPYTVTKFQSSPKNPAAYYQMFTMPFPSHEVLQQTLASTEMQAVAADANRISSGGAPVVLLGKDR